MQFLITTLRPFTLLHNWYGKIFLPSSILLHASRRETQNPSQCDLKSRVKSNVIRDKDQDSTLKKKAEQNKTKRKKKTNKRSTDEPYRFIVQGDKMNQMKDEIEKNKVQSYTNGYGDTKEMEKLKKKGKNLISVDNLKTIKETVQNVPAYDEEVLRLKSTETE